MNIKDPNYNFIFHATDKNKELISNYILNESIQNLEIINDDKIKTADLKKSKEYDIIVRDNSSIAIFELL